MCNLMINIYYSDGFGYTGGEFKLIYQDIIGYLQGSNKFFFFFLY